MTLLLTPSFALLAVSLIASIDASPIINSPPALIQCQPAALTWTGAAPPVYLRAVQGSDTAGDALMQFPTQMSESGTYTWPAVNLTSGTTITLVINDKSGMPNFSSQLTIKDGDKDCLNGGSASSGATTSPATTNTPATTPSTSTPSSGSSGSSGASGASGSAASTGATAKNSTSSSTTPASEASASGATSGTASTHTPSSSSPATGNTTATSAKTTTTSGSQSVLSVSTANTILVGAAAAVAGVYLGAGLF